MYKVVRIIARFLFIFLFRIEVKGHSNIPKEGRLLVCSNHSRNWDPLILSASIKRQIHWMAKRELFEISVLKLLLPKVGAFPVDRKDTDVAAIKTALRVLKNENLLGIFPEGTRVSNFSVENAKAGVAMIAIKAKACVLPVYITQNYKVFKKVTINIGKPIDYYSNLEGRLDNEEYLKISQDILTKIYELGGE